MNGRRALALVLLLCWPLTHARAQEALPAARYQALVTPIPQFRLPAPLAARESLLTLDFEMMRGEARGRDWLLGGMLVISAALVGFGSAYPRQVGALLLPLGAAGLIRGVVGLTLQPDPRLAAGTYLRMPAFTREQAEARLAHGEQALAAQAAADRRARLLDGSLSFLVAGSYVPLAYLIERRHDPDYRFGDDGYGYALLALSVVNAAAAVVTAFSETENEQRNRKYRALVTRQAQTAAGKLSFRLEGAPRGLQLGTRLRF